jgi:putative ABC transport system permease protein
MRYIVRSVLKSPGFALAAILALGVGIGSNATMFAVADVLAFRPVTLPHLERLVCAVAYANNEPIPDEISAADYEDWKDQTKTLEGMAAVRRRSINLSGDGTAERLRGSEVSPEFFGTVGVGPARGRIFLSDEYQSGNNRPVVLSYGLWLRRYGADSGVVGRDIRLDGLKYRVVGIMPADFDYSTVTDLWLPLIMTPELRHTRGVMDIEVVAQLKPGVSREQADAEFATFGRRAAEQFPATHARRTASVISLKQKITGVYTYSYSVLMVVASAFLLLIACSNVASLQFVRATARAREMALRTALGASRWRIVRQVLGESLILAAGATLVGFGVAQWGIEVTKSYLPPEVQKYLPGWGRMSINGLVFLYTVAVAAASGIVAGVLPAWKTSRADVNEILKEGGRTGTATAAKHRVRNLLVALEVALSVVLLVGAGIMARGVNVLSHPIANLEPDNVLALSVILTESKYAGAKDWNRYFDDVLARVQSVPGVESAGLVTDLPFNSSPGSVTFAIDGYTPSRGEVLSARHQGTSSGYFRTMRIPLLEGRAFTSSDGPDAPRVAIVSEDLAHLYWSHESALGKRILVGKPAPGNEWATVIGVVAGVTSDPFERTLTPTIYRPYRQTPSPELDIAVRSAGGASSILPAVRAALAAVDPDQAPFNVRSQQKAISDSLVGLAYVATMLSVCGAIALILASIGLYAVMAFVVTSRTHEIGIRMALGAGIPDVLRLVVRQGIVVTGCGVLAGLLGALALARLISGLIFGVSSSDPVTFLLSSAILTAVAALATSAPAWRATRVQPLVALRHE